MWCRHAISGCDIGTNSTILRGETDHGTAMAGRSCALKYHVGDGGPNSHSTAIAGDRNVLRCQQSAGGSNAAVQGPKTNGGRHWIRGGIADVYVKTVIMVWLQVIIIGRLQIIIWID